METINTADLGVWLELVYFKCGGKQNVSWALQGDLKILYRNYYTVDKAVSYIKEVMNIKEIAI